MKAMKKQPHVHHERLEREAIERFRKLLDPDPPPPDWRRKSAEALRLVWNAFAPRDGIRVEGVDLEQIRLNAMNSQKRSLWK